MKMLPTGLLLAVALLPALGQAQTVNICDRTPQVRDAILRHLGVTERFAEDSVCGTVSAAQMQGITRITYTNSNRLTTLKAGDFANLPSLQSLYLDDNELTALPEDLFDGLTSLQSLWLSGNRLTTLPEGLFDGLTSLQSLPLFDNQLTALPEGLFDGLTSLQGLGLRGNRLTTLPEGLFDGLTALRNLDLQDNRLTALPEGLFDGLTSLQALYLHDNRLTALPEDLFDGLTSLQYLTLQDNQLTALLAGVFAGLIGLNTLDLSNNRLTALPAGVFDSLTSMYALNLQGNQLTRAGLPVVGVFAGLTNLIELDLRYNHLVGLTRNDPSLNLVSTSVDVLLGNQTEAPEQPEEPADDGDNGDGNGGSDSGATAPTHTHPIYAPIGHAHDAADFHTHVEAYDVRYASGRHHHDAAYAALSHTHPKRTAARLRLACGERCEAMASQPDIADLIEDTFWLEQAQCSTPRTRDIGAASCQNSTVGRSGLTYCGGGEGNLNSLMTNPPSGIGGKEITISEGVKASVAQTLALQIAELGLTCEEAAVVLYRGQFHLDSCRAQADYGRMAQAIAKATGWDGEGVTLPTFTTITRSRKCGDALAATQ